MEEKIAAKLTQNFARNRRKIFGVGFVLFLFSVSFAMGEAAQAASLYFSPSSGSYAVGQTFSVNVYVSSSDQSMNAASGVVSFPPDKLEIISLSKAGSIFSLWVQEPTFSNTVGNIIFEGIVLNPGFTGHTGKILTVNFRVKLAGDAPLLFNSGSVLANDGQGTNILSSMPSAQFDLNTSAIKPSAPEATTPAITGGAPAAPVITSSTHPEPNKWYSNNTPEFSWEVPSGVTAVKLLIGRLAIATPTVYYSPAISEKKIDEELPDGTYYFHARFKNKNGWGAISHRKVLIDTHPPKPFSIKFPNGESDDPRPIVLFNTTDLMSGIDYYKVKIGDGDFFITTQSVLHNPYTLPLQGPGKHTVIVQAHDKAGNTTTASEEFIILAIETPVITDYPKKLTVGETLTIKGETYPDVAVTVWLQKEGEEAFAQNVASSEEGNFEFTCQSALGRGIYKMRAEATDSRGAKSYPTETYVIAVESALWSRITSFLISYLSLIILLLSIIFSFICLGWYSWYKFSVFKKKIKKETREAEEALHKAFDLLRDEFREQINVLEKTKTKRGLTKEEDKIVRRLKKDLDDAERFIRKEIKDIEKEIK